jgi:hypothetical protein
VTELAEGQWAINDVTFGPYQDILLSKFEWGAPDISASDSPTPRGDGMSFGRDYRGSRTLSCDLTVQGNGYGVLDRLATLEAEWQSNRDIPDAVSILRYRRGGQTKRVYGRGRRFQADSTLDWAGRVDVTCDFVTTDHLFYDDEERAENVPFIPNATGGLIGGQVGGWEASDAGDSSGLITVGGTVPAWLVWRINGPLTGAEIEVVGRWKAKLATTIAYDQFVLVDPTPWNRSVRRGDGANYAGMFTADSVRLSEMRVPPGQNQVLLRGIDPTATASMQLFWRNASSSY